jgi:protein ImuB
MSTPGAVRNPHVDTVGHPTGRLIPDRPGADLDMDAILAAAAESTRAPGRAGSTMGLRGCISIDSLPLQILLNDNPGWAGTPIALTREERPQSSILALNREAREKGLAVGMKYASALSIVPDLRARAVPADRIAEARAHLVQSLIAFTPDIELCPFDADALWVWVEGLRSLYTTEAAWSQKVRCSLEAEGFQAIIVIGFTRFGTYAIARRTRARSVVFATREQEQPNGSNNYSS